MGIHHTSVGEATSRCSKPPRPHMGTATGKRLTIPAAI